jgi:hypothetical protein
MARDATRDAQILADAQAGKRPPELAATYGLSMRTIYHILQGRCVQPRKRRADSGRSRSGVPTETWDALMKLIHTNGYGAGEAIAHLQAQVPPMSGAETLTVGWVNDQLRQLQTTKKQMKKTGPGAFHRRECKEANGRHQADATPICLFYMDLRGDINYEPDSVLDKARNHQGKTKINVFGLVDEHSRAGYLRGYAGGEKQDNWLDFFYRAWSRKSDPTHNPFCGMPTVLYCDKGSGLIGRTTTRALAEIGVKAVSHMAGKPYKKGKAERYLKTFQQLCEPELRGRTFHSLDDLNIWLEEKAQYLGNRTHGTTGEAPFSLWSRSMREQAVGIVEPPTPEEWQRLALHEAENVLVRRDFTMTFGGERIEVPQSDLWMAYIGHKIRVLYRPNGKLEEPVLAILPPLSALALAGCEVRLSRVRPGTMPAGFASGTNLVTPGRLRLQASLDAETPELDLSRHHLDAVREYPVIQTARKAMVINNDLFLARPLSQIAAIAEGQRRGMLASPLSDSPADMAWITELVPEGTTLDESEFARALAEYARGKRHATSDSPARHASAGM